MESNDQDPSGNVKDDKADLKLGLTIGIPAAALLIAVVATIVVLLKTGKLKCSCTNRPKRSKKDFAQQEERKKSIIIIAPTGKKGSELYIARHFYEAEDDNQLSLETGRIVEVQEKLDNGWWRGVTGGKEGWFPATFVKKIDVSDPNSSMHSLSSAVSSTPGSTRHPPPPTGKPPANHEVSTSADIYVNSAFELENTDADCQSSEYSRDSYLDAETDCNNTSKNVTDKTNKDEHKFIIDNDIDNKLDVMKTEDIEGYLNEIFSVEDETPEAPRKNKLCLSKHSRDHAYQGGNKKWMKDEQNKSLLKEQSQTADAKIRMLNKKCHSKKSKGSPLINPEHYMISSSESLFSVSSCNEDGDTSDEQQVITLKSKEEDAERVYDKPDSGQTNKNHDVHRGAPDGSSLVGVLPDGQKEFSLEREFMNEEDFNKNINTEDGLHEKVSDRLTPEKNLQKNMISVSTENKLVFVVIYPFTPTDANQLTLAVNELVYSLGEEENGWMKGEKKSSGETGWFPISYVRKGKPLFTRDILSEESEALDSDGEFEDDDNMTGLEYRVLYPYKAQQDGDLTLNEGDIIIVTESHDNGWWRGCLGEQEGWFPGTYVEPVPQTPASSVYEDVRCPLKMSAPLSTSSPVDRVDEKNEEQSMAVIKETMLRADNLGSSGIQPASTENVNNALSPVSPVNIRFKPHVPRRFVKPKLVILPKQRKNSMKALKKPSRPPPPVPKDCGSIYSNEGKVPSKGHSMDMNDDVSMNIIQHKRKTLPRPKEPPPPAPVISAIIPKDNAPSVNTLKIDSSFSNANENNPVFSQSVQNEDYEDVEPGLQLALSNTERKASDSGLGIDISIPGVHTSARLEHNDKSKTATPDSPESRIGSSLLDSMDHDKSCTDVQHEDDLTPKGFDAILGIFKRIVQRDDPSVANDDPMLCGEDSLAVMIKPVLPPKPAKNKVNFRRSHSEPDLLGLTTTSRSKLCDKNFTTDHVDGVAVIGSSKALDKVKPASSKPALPPRPKMPPHRSQSVGSLVLLKGAEKLIPTGVINKTAAEVIQKHDIHAKPEKPHPPSVNMKVYMDKKQFTVGHKGADIVVKKPASAADVIVLDTAKHSAEEATLNNSQLNANTTLSNEKMKSEKEQILLPLQPVQPPVNPSSVTVNKSFTSQMDKLATSTHAEKQSMIHDKTSITDQSVSRSTLILDGDRGQRQKILSNGSLKMSTSPEGGVEYPHVLWENRLNESPVQDPSVPGVPMEHLDDVVSNVCSYSTGSPSQPRPPPLPFSPPPGLINLGEAYSGTGSKTRDSSEAYQADRNENPCELTPSDGRTLHAPVNIQKSSLRFFTPVGFSRSYSISGVCSSDITISSAKTSAGGSLSPYSTNAPASQKADSTSGFAANQVNRNHASALDSGQKSPSSLSISQSTKKNNSLQFYTPVGFISHRNHLSKDEISHEQTCSSSSEQNLSAQPHDDRPEKFGSTGSLEHPSSKYYQPYASVELKPTVKRTLTPPKPFLPSRWSAYSRLQKGNVSLAMVDIEIEDGSNTAREDTKTVNKVIAGQTEIDSSKSSLLMISQADLESDV